MSFSDLNFILQWWLMLFGVGIIFLPLTAAVFSRFFDRGYIFAKVLGTIVVSYIIFILGILHLAPFTQTTITSVLIALFMINLFILAKVTPWLRSHLKRSWKIFLFEELIFFLGLLFWSYVRAHQPDIHGLEKFMDFGFVNSILRSGYFPPKDMWFTPLPINYYFFGHLITAVLTKLSGIPSSVTYNLMLSTIFALTFTGAFSVGMNFLFELNAKRYTLYAIIGGFLTAFLVVLAGNLHTVYSLFKPYSNENPVPFWQLVFSPQTFPNSYWYPNATRFIYNTIHEFPLYSFVVSDLHGHVLNIPIVLLTIATLLSIIQNSKFKIQNYSSKLKIFKLQLFTFNFSLLTLLAFLLAVMSMTNAWDGLIYAGLTLFVFSYLAYRSKNYKLYAISYALIIIGSIIFSLPFSLNFKPFASQIGILCAPDFLIPIGNLGPFLFEPNHCQRSPLWQIFILYGFFYFWSCLFIGSRFSVFRSLFTRQAAGNRQLKTENKTIDIFVLLLILFSTVLILAPELIYLKDIYPAHYRANTMFKLGYQAFILLSIASGYIAIQVISNKQKAIRKVLKFFLISCLLSPVSIYSYLAINSYYGNLQAYYGLNGTSYLRNSYPTDYEAILWLNKSIKGQPVILEAQGDSYTDYARVSANTGLPTVLGWTVHEWLWRGSYNIPAPRIEEVKTLYESSDLNLTKKLIRKYNIELVFIGDLERQKYPNLNGEKFQDLGKIIYQNGQTKIYKI